MISKEKFVKYMSTIKNAVDKDTKFDQTIRSLNKAGEGIAWIYIDEINAMIEMVCDLMDIEYNANEYYGDEIQWFIYEQEWGENDCPILDTYGKNIYIKTIEELYDFIVEETSINEELGILGN